MTEIVTVENGAADDEVATAEAATATMRKAISAAMLTMAHVDILLILISTLPTEAVFLCGS